MFAALQGAPTKVTAVSIENFDNKDMEGIAGLNEVESVEATRCPDYDITGIYRIACGPPPLTNAGLLIDLPATLRRLILRFAEKIDDDGLHNVQYLTNLQHLDFSGCDGLTNKGLFLLRRLRHLEFLSLYGLRCITAAGLKAMNIRGMTELRHIDLSHTRIAADAVPLLAGLPRLEYLNLKRCEGCVTDDAIELIANIKTLQHLILSHAEDRGDHDDVAPITDAGWSRLSQLVQLRRLDISGNPSISNSTLSGLPPMLQLEYLDVSTCRYINPSCKNKLHTNGLCDSSWL